jgi:tyrosine-protein kinase
MDLARLITIVRNYLWLIVGSTALAIVVAFAVTSVLPKSYTARATLVVGPGINGRVQGFDELQSALQLSKTYALAATTVSMAQDMISTFELDQTTEEFLKTVSVETSRDTSSLVIAVEAPTPGLAADIANGIAGRLVDQAGIISGTDEVILQAVRSQIDDLQQAILETRSRVTTLQAIDEPKPADLTALAAAQDQLVSLQASLAALLSSTTTGNAGAVTILDAAVEPLEPSSPRMLINLLIAAIVGLVMGMLFAVGLSSLDDSLKSSVDAQAVLGLPIRGVIGRIRGASLADPRYRLSMLLYPRSTVSEAFRKLRTSLTFGAEDDPIKSMVVTSASRAEGKTTVAANLALAFAQNGTRTVLVDADLRQPMLHELFGLRNDKGLSTALRSEGPKVEPYLVSTEEPNLRILTAGPVPDKPAELLASARMRALIESLTRSAGMVILDSPPLLAVTDAALLATSVDGALFVVTSKRTKKAAARTATSTLRSVGSRILGVVVVSPKGAEGSDAYETYPTADNETEARSPVVSSAR